MGTAPNGSGLWCSPYVGWGGGGGGGGGGGVYWWWVLVVVFGVGCVLLWIL